MVDDQGAGAAPPERSGSAEDSSEAADGGGQPDVTYGGYLSLAAILDAQHPLSPPELGSQVQSAEHFFIVVHQAFELWFKQELMDLRCATDALAPAEHDAELALDHLQRVA